MVLLRTRCRLSTEKREVAVLIPYKMADKEISFFLQIRDQNAPRLPGFFGMFGGGLENTETPEEALKREIREELELELTDQYRLFSRYEAITTIKHVYILQVDEGFEHSVTVHEGDGGKFLSQTEVIDEQKICDLDRLVLVQLGKSLKNEPTW